MDERHAQLLVERLQLYLHLLPELEVEGTERFVQQQHARLEYERPGEGHPLALATRQLGRLAGRVDTGVESHQFEGRTHAVADFGGRSLSLLQAKGNVALHAEMREQRVALEHHGEVAFIGPPLVDYLAEESDFAFVGCLEACEQAQCRRLAAA